MNSFFERKIIHFFNVETDSYATKYIIHKQWHHMLAYMGVNTTIV
jgi:hypothetical protein